MAVLFAGKFPGEWHSQERKSDFYDIKGLAETLVGQLRLLDLQWIFGQCSSPITRHKAFEVRDRSGELLLWGGALNPKVLKEYDVSAPCFGLELEMSALFQTPRLPKSYQPLPKFPSAWRDIALVVPDGVTSHQVTVAIQEMGGPELVKVHLFDLYRGTNLSAGTRSLAYRLHFLNEERTKTEQEVTEKVSKIVGHLKTRYTIALR